jgi:bifunctional non-homologous end joining protein LigD
LRDIHSKLEPLIIAKSPFAAAGKIPRKVTWVKPELVCNVKYLEFTPDNQLRAPVFLGLRADKDPKECVREVAEPVEQVVKEARTGALLANDSPNDVALTIDGQALKFTNLNKVFWPGEKITKRDLINYYDAIADLILPHLHDRPLSLKRYPNGIDKPFFFQKNAEQFPDWVRLEPIHSEHSSRDIHYTICNDRATLLFLANLACIDQNPWMSRLSHLENPDFALIDLDPTEGCPYHQIVEAAQLVRAKLELIGLEGCPKTTGGDGMHIYIPLKPVYSYDQVRSFAEILSMLVIHEDPALFTTPRAVSARKKGKVYFDYLQIASSKTISAPYVVRAYQGAPVSTPLEWSEVKKGLEPGDFTIRNAPARFEKKGDLFGGVLANPQRLETALEKLAGLVGAG